MSLDAFVQSPFSGKQLRSIRGCTASVNIWDGSIRAGKTLVSLFAWMIFIADAPPTGEIVMIGRTSEDLPTGGAPRRVPRRPADDVHAPKDDRHRRRHRHHRS